MEVLKMPKAALHFMDHDGFAQVNDRDRFHMVAYSGGVIKNHWYWGDLVIDLEGLSFPKSKYPILENHQTDRKIAFAKKPDTAMGMIEFSDAEFVDTQVSEEFRKLSKQGFPYEASIYATPTSVEKVGAGEKAEVNGMTIKGPASIWRKAIFKEASVCVFGYDSNTKSAAFASDEIEIAIESINGMADQPNNPTTKEEVKKMDFEQFSKDYPELLAEIVERTTNEVTEKLTSKFQKEKKELKDKLAQERDGFSEERKEFEKKVAALEKAEAIRREKELKFEAKAIWIDRLNESSIPDRLFDKVMSQVRHDQFVKDDNLDRDAFVKAVDAEIEDWESRGISSDVSGFGISVKDVEDKQTKQKQKEDEADEDLASKLFALSGAEKEVS